MNFWTFIFLVIAAGLAYDVWTKRHLAQHGHLQDENGKLRPLAQGRERELEAELADLRERLHVLERIATDGARPAALAAEIEALREKD